MHSRCVLKGATYLITRRTALRQCFLKQRDLPVVEQAIKFCLAHAAAKYGVSIHAFEFLWTHYHLVITDLLGSLPLFEAWLNRHVALIAKILRGIYENVFAIGSYSAVSLNAPIAGDVDRPPRLLETPEDVLAAMDYVELNCVESRLVSSPGLWPGVTSWMRRLNEPEVIKRPEVYFSRISEVVPEAATLVIEKPPVFGDIDLAEFAGMRTERLQARQASLLADFAERGFKFLGLRNILRMRHTDRATSIELIGGLNPHIAGKDRSIRIGRIRALRAFRRQHRDALIAFATDRAVEFPAGTYRMRVLHAVNVRFPECCPEPRRPDPLPT
ncbi:MAG: transposase [Planctomycetota bacterium]